AHVTHVEQVPMPGLVLYIKGPLLHIRRADERIDECVALGAIWLGGRERRSVRAPEAGRALRVSRESHVEGNLERIYIEPWIWIRHIDRRRHVRIEEVRGRKLQVR